MRQPARASLPARLLVTVALVAAVVAGAAPAAADDCDGVWVVVDATRLGGSVRTLCAADAPSDGFDALRRVGVSYTFVERVPGMVCTLDGLPDPCNGAPADAYWSYWHAEAGGSWTYSNRGAGNRTPAKGTVEGWAFGSGQQPGRQPPAAAAAAPSPSPTSSPSPSPSPTQAPPPSPSPSPTRTPEPSATGAPQDDPADDRDRAGTPAAVGDGSADRDDATNRGEVADTNRGEVADTDGGEVADTDAGIAAGARNADDADAGDGGSDLEGLYDETREDVDHRRGAAGRDGNDAGDDTAADDEVGGTGDDPVTGTDDTVTLGDVPAGGGGVPVGAVAGGVLIAGLAGAGVWRSRQRLGA